MAITIDYITNEILVPKADTTFIEFDPLTGREKRSLDLTVFGIALGDVQDDQEGAWASTAYFYTQTQNVGGINLAPVLNILSPYVVTFEAGNWAVFLINGNTNVQDVSTVNGVAVFPSNSGGLVGADEISNQSYLDARVFINTVIGTANGIGTPTSPVDDFPAAKSIADVKNLNGYRITGSISVDNTDDIAAGNFKGENSNKSEITFTGVDADNCNFDSLTVKGSISSGRASFENCSLGDGVGLTGFDGEAVDCSMPNSVQLSSSGTKPITFRKCYSNVAGTGKPIVDCDGVTMGINVREQVGGLEVVNFNGGGDMSIDAGGVLRLTIASTCTAGTIVVGGMVLLDDQSGVGCTVIALSSVTSLTDDGDKITRVDKILQADEEKNVQTNKFYKRDKDTQEILVEKDYAIDGNNNETLTKP